MISRIKDIIQTKPYVQIGANIGHDIFYTLCKETTPTSITLVEPFKECHTSLKECYKNITCDVNYECLAIVEDDTQSANLYSATGLKEHASIIPLQDWSDEIVLTVDACNINELFEKYNLHDIGILFIDTEGSDARIIDSIDFDKINIDIIVYEDWSFNVDWFKTDHKLNGVRGMKYIEDKLKSIGYEHEAYRIPELTYLAYKK